MPELLQTTLEVPYKGENFVFKIPTIHDDLRVGGRMAALRAVTDPTWSGNGAGLDRDSAFMLRAAAVFETLLQSGPEWCWSKDPTGKPFVDTSKIPVDKTEAVYDVYSLYGVALDSFRNPRAPNDVGAGQEALASGTDPQ